MFTASNSTTRFAGFTFAVLMALAINGSMLLTFESVATPASLAQSANAGHVAVLDTVTIVGQRI